MKRICARVMLVVCCVGSRPFVASCAEQDAATLIQQSSATKGDAYRRLVASAESLRDAAVHIRTHLAGDALSTEERLTARILWSRLTYPNVFEMYKATLESFRERQQSSRPLGTRPGLLSGILYSFATSGPESKTVSVRTGTRQVGNIVSPKYEQVSRYTQDEVIAGISRNQAARAAILEHLLKFAEEGSEYEQQELVEAARLLWGEESRTKHDDGVPLDALLERLSQDETRRLSVRVAAMTLLPVGMRRGEHELMLAVLQSQETCNDTEHNRVVLQAIGYLKEHDPQALNGIRTETRWKQVLINEAAGLPAPSRQEAVPDDDIVVDISE